MLHSRGWRQTFYYDSLICDNSGMGQILERMENLSRVCRLKFISRRDIPDLPWDEPTFTSFISHVIPEKCEMILGTALDDPISANLHPCCSSGKIPQFDA
jgi:hypothetical protein